MSPGFALGRRMTPTLGKVRIANAKFVGDAPCVGQLA